MQARGAPRGAGPDPPGKDVAGREGPVRWEVGVAKRGRDRLSDTVRGGPDRGDPC